MSPTAFERHIAILRAENNSCVARFLYECSRPSAQSVIDVYWNVSQLIAVVETEEFLADVKGVLSEYEHDALILYVAQHPEAGVLIPETGGLRKLRWASKGKGKRGGSRAIYYFHNIEVPLFLMAIYAKNVQTDLSAQQRTALAAQLRALKRDWKEKKTK